MERLSVRQPDLVGREEELLRLEGFLENSTGEKGSTVFIAGEAGIGKTRLVNELKKKAESKGVNIIQGWCLAESLEPLMPIKAALREAGMHHLISGDPPPMVVSAYLMNSAGMLIAQAERGESDLDADIFAGMLQAVGNFVQDSLSMMTEEGKGGLNSLGYQDHTILIQTHGSMSLAVVIRGTNSEFLVDDMKRILVELGSKFDDWSGNVNSAREALPKVSWFIDSGKYDGEFLVDDPKLKQENLFDNILLGIQRASLERPLLLFLDDLQWSDPTSLNLIHYLARNTRKNSVLILGTYRPEDIVEGYGGKPHSLETAMQGMNREELLERIELKRLDAKHTREVAESMLGCNSFDQGFFDRIYKETDGSPFFILEIIKLLMEDGAIRQNEEDTWQLVRMLDELDIPSRVYDVIKRRLDRLMKDQKEILECASVIGEEFGSDIVGNIVGQNRIQLLRNLSEIEKTHKLIHYLQDRYRFDHAKIKEVLYSGIGEELRKEYHRIIGDTIAELYQDNLDEITAELAHHYYKAGDKRAGDYLVKAGDMAREDFANEEAARLYAHALETLKDDGEKLTVLENLGDVLALGGEFDAAIENLDRADGMATDNETEARILRKVGEVHEKKGEYDRSLEMLARARKILKEEDNAEYGRILIGEGQAHQRKGDYDTAMPLLIKAMRIFENFGGSQKDMGNALRAVGNIYFTRAEYNNALEYYEKSLGVMESIGEQYGVAATLNGIGAVHHHRGELARALEYQQRSLGIFENIGAKQGIAFVLSNIGNVYFSRGELDRALKHYEHSLAIREKSGAKQGIVLALSNIGLVHNMRGEFDLALKYQQRSLEIYENMGDKRGVAQILNFIGEVHLDRAEPNRALEHFERSLEIFENIGARQGISFSLSNVGMAYLEKGELDRALEYTEKAVEIAVELGAKREEAEGLRREGMVLRQMTDWDRAVSVFEEANKTFEEAGIKDELPRLYYERGLLRKAMGKDDMAREYLEKALSGFENMGMGLWARRVEKALVGLEPIKLK